MKKTSEKIFEIIVFIALVCVPAILILNAVAEGGGGINSVLAAGSLLLVAVLIRNGIRAVRKKNGWGWVMIIAAVALFFYMDGRSSLYGNLLIGIGEAILIIAMVLVFLLFAAPLLSLFLDW